MKNQLKKNQLLSKEAQARIEYLEKEIEYLWKTNKFWSKQAKFGLDLANAALEEKRATYPTDQFASKNKLIELLLEERKNRIEPSLN